MKGSTSQLCVKSLLFIFDFIFLYALHTFNFFCLFENVLCIIWLFLLCYFKSVFYHLLRDFFEKRFISSWIISHKQQVLTVLTRKLWGYMEALDHTHHITGEWSWPMTRWTKLLCPSWQLAPHRHTEGAGWWWYMYPGEIVRSIWMSSGTPRGELDLNGYCDWCIPLVFTDGGACGLCQSARACLKPCGPYGEDDVLVATGSDPARFRWPQITSPQPWTVM